MPIDFKKLMLGRFSFTFAVQMQVIVLGWRMYELTHDALYLGLIGLAEAIPAIGLALVAGYVVDRSRPLVVYRRVVMVSFISGLVMLFSQLPQLGVSLDAQVILLFVSSFLTGSARAFSQPSMYSMVPRIIPKELLSKSSAWMSSAMQIARISGPAAGGLLFAFIGVSGTATVVCVFLVLTLIFLYSISFSPLPLPLQGDKKSVQEELLLGAKFVIKHPILFPALTLDMVSVLFGGVTALLPVYAAEILFVGPKGLGLLRAAPAVGAAIMSFTLIKWDIKTKAGQWLFWGVGGFGASILVFAISESYVLSFVALLLSGVFDSISMVVRTSAVQLMSPDHMRGRISAVNTIFIGSSNEIGEFESGVAAKFLGTMPAAVLGGCLCLATVGLTALISPTLRKLDLNEWHPK